MHNVILLITDTYRYDNLADRAEAMPVRTPELDAFAAERATAVEGFYTGSFPTIYREFYSYVYSAGIWICNALFAEFVGRKNRKFIIKNAACCSGININVYNLAGCSSSVC